MAHKKYMLTTLLIILAFNYVDRLALGLLLQDIKRDLDLTDTHLGFLSGIAFALFYAVMGIPIARWADRGNRVLIIAITTAVWSVAVALCGIAGSFVQLLLIRVGVAIGEAGCIPPAHSLIADSFSRAERPRAVAIYMLGWPISGVFGYFLAGWLNELYGWRATFVLLGLPGLALAALAWFTLREPSREKASASVRPLHSAHTQIARTSLDEPSFKDVCWTLWENTTFRHLLFCWSVISFFGYGITQWQPAFFIRSFGIETGELGSWFALVGGASGFLGTYLGGALATRRAAHNESLQLKAMSIVYCGFGVLSASIYLSSNHYLAFALLALATAGVSTVGGPLFATIQTLVPARMRAMSIAIIYLFGNLIGMGFGPVVVGALSDALRPMLGEESLRYSLLAISPGYLWGAWHLWRGSRTVLRDVNALQRDQVGPFGEGRTMNDFGSGLHGSDTRAAFSKE